MRARELLDGTGAGFTAETMKAVNQAFAGAWAQIAPQYSDATATEKARLKLAECILAVTRDGATDAEQIERLALTMFRVSKLTSASRLRGRLANIWEDAHGSSQRPPRCPHHLALA